MSGSDKKGQAFNSDKGVSGGGATFVIQDPDVSHFVMDATTGLISKQTLESGDLQVTIQTWGGAEPPAGETETFSLQYTQAGSDVWQLFQEHTHTGGIRGFRWYSLFPALFCWMIRMKAPLIFDICTKTLKVYPITRIAFPS